MSLEAKIEALTAAVVALTAKLEAGAAPAAPVVIAAPAPSAPQTFTAPAPVAPVVAMPAPPSFVAPAPVAAAPAGAPFSDPKGLIDYVMNSYKALGPQKGAQIQTVLTSMGYGNINDVKPEHYGALFTGVEALK
jgi:hypothetical protein